MLATDTWHSFEDISFSWSCYEKIDSSFKTPYHSPRDDSDPIATSKSFLYLNIKTSFYAIWLYIISYTTWSLLSGHFSHIHVLTIYPVFLIFTAFNIHLHKSTNSLTSQILGLLNSSCLHLFSIPGISHGYILVTVITHNFYTSDILDPSATFKWPSPTFSLSSFFYFKLK